MPSNQHVNRPLTNVSVAFMQDTAKEYVSDKVFPIVPVLKRSDIYPYYTPDNWYRTGARERGPAQQSAGGDFEVDLTNTYYCKRVSNHMDIDEDDRANTDQPMNPDQDATEFVTQQNLLKREIDWAALFFVTSLWTGSSTGGDITPSTAWDAANSTPIKDMRAQIRAVHTKTGIKPNTALFAADTWDALLDNADLLDRMKTTDDKSVTRMLLARLLEIDRVLVAEGIQNTANEGATATMAQIMTSGDAWIGYAAPKPGLKKPSAGYTFAWTGAPGTSGASQGSRVKKFWMDKEGADRIEADIYYGHKVIAPNLGAYFDGTLT